ncbi:MAG: hypothetical protein G01um101448_960 [Parcubacteria group bacterium Gr01-1014_48]|nr:MAG: hypothetical protein Greene041614_569 [Parcubacteria group bacterium Greene0416_14]TSC72531.1 MAG: hypothetical protein G01um101448_960 [Parcubacteria group bacterium Gr01-1014_48]TSD00585.1 MAG: hypothetical protein Greene101415_806 [Parcubacteria group bacterium Greene1014_15]TSD08276.1 MAG: hypothetical protein Greene07144_258 [Parcubacteria group bacterium Greene0714_4]
MDSATKRFIQEKNEKLAIMVAKGFAATKQDIEELERKMDERFEEVDERFEKIDERFDDLEISIGKRHQETDELRDRVKVLEHKTGVR